MTKTRIKELGRGVSVPFDAECQGEFVWLLRRVGGGPSSDQFLAGLAWGGGEMWAVSTSLLWGEINPEKNQKGAPRMDKESER